MPIFDVQAGLETVEKTLLYESEAIKKDYAEDFQNYAQSEPTEKLPKD